MKKLALLGTVLAAGVGALVVTNKSHAADHLDAPTIKMTANAMADINDVYTWNTSDGKSVNLVMTVSPGDDGTRHFGPSVQYVFHVASHPGATNAAAIGTPGTESKVICTFTSDTAGKCWVVLGTTVKDYVAGDFSATAGLASTDSKIKVFAGRRADPFFFNLAGFKAAVAAVEGTPGLTPNAAGCPSNVPEATAAFLRTTLSTVVVAGAAAPCANNQIDCFENFNVMAISIQVDKTLLLQGSDTLLSVWGSSHAAPQ